MEDLRLDFEPFVSEPVRQFIVDGVVNHNIALTNHAAYYPTNFILRSQRREVLGGLLGHIWGHWLQVTFLWVAEPIRHRGNGSRLLNIAEDYAIERGCDAATLETHSFQARPFYEKHGYSVFGTLSDYPPGHAKFFLQKKLRR
jgi:GNAT superfamily N-acetyltransferase